MPERGVLILECLDQADPGSEGLFLAHMFNLMEIEHQYVEVRTKHQILALLQKSPYEIIHITTHGSVKRRKKTKKFNGLWVKDGIITKNELKRSIQNKLAGYTVVSTACLSGKDLFAEDFTNITACDYYVAPSGSPGFYDAIFFAHIFYHKYFIKEKSVVKILAEYNKRYKNPHNFSLVSFEDYIDITID